jgi:hypothetical protein
LTNAERTASETNSTSATILSAISLISPIRVPSSDKIVAVALIPQRVLVNAIDEASIQKGIPFLRLVTAE